MKRSATNYTLKVDDAKNLLYKNASKRTELEAWIRASAREIEGRARTRIISTYDIVEFMFYLGNTKVELTYWSSEGFVPYTYHYKAETTSIHAQMNKARTKFTVWLERGPAQRIESKAHLCLRDGEYYD